MLLDGNSVVDRARRSRARTSFIVVTAGVLHTFKDIQLQQFIHAIPHEVAVLNCTGTIVAVNRAWRAFAGDDGLINTSIDIGTDYLAVCDLSSAGGSDEAGRIAAGIRELTTGDRADFRDHYECAIPDRGLCHFQLQAFALECASGRFVVMMHVDITPLYSQLEAAQRQEVVLHAMLDGILDVAIFRMGTDGRVVTWNAGAELVTGWTKSEAIGMHYENVVCPEDHASGSSRDNLARAAAGPIERLDEHRVRKDGTKYVARISLFPLRDLSGQLVGFAEVLQDVTAQRLGQLVREQLARELAQKHKELEQFVQTVSHELKTPLVTITGFAGHLMADLKAGQTQDVEHHAERILGAATRMRRHVDDQLELCQIGRVVHEARAIDLPTMFDGVRIQVLSEHEGCDDVEIVCRFDVQTVFADPVRIHQVLKNLLSNAIKYGRGSAPPRIEVGSDRDGNTKRIYVKDNGPGIAREHHERIFVLFQHLGQSKDSTGIGLTIVQRVAEVHGGRAWVESTPGNGATFYVSLVCPERTLSSSPPRETPVGASL